MPHRNNKDMEELEKSLKIITAENNNNNIIIAGDFNCPYIQWKTLSLKHEASDKEVQRTLIDIISQSGLAQLHEEPTRENNLIDPIFTTTLTLAKTSTNIPGISDHAIIVTDIDTKPYYQQTNPRKSCIWAKADWEQVKQDLDTNTKYSRNDRQ
jgi:endonuclease/exonuclease/phosphatase family metal-dependent hydrolase